MPRFNAQTAVTNLESKVDRMTSLMERFLSGVGPVEPQAAVTLPVKQLPEIAPINPAVVATEPPVRSFMTKPELAERAAATTGVQVDEGEEHFVEPLPKDDPNVKGPCWSSKTLRNKYGTFPAHHRRHDPQTKRLVTVRYDVSPADRSNFMAETQGRTFGFDLTLPVSDGKGGEKMVRFPAVATIAAKQFSSFDHGLYAKVDSLTVTLPSGAEYVLDGQINLQLKKRMQ